MEFVELGSLSVGDWLGLVGHERAPFGPASAGLTFRPKDRHIGARNDAGRLVAVVGAAIATVEVVGYGQFDVVGLGGFIIHREARGSGLAGQLMDRMTPLVESMGPDRAMLFCEPDLMRLYARKGYTPIPAKVSADQPDGRIEVPIPAMWRALRPTHWPAGVVELHGPPF
ncbi:MAG: GNAT family N-acetyltransferase [Solirubrobacteraceae bacterium]